MLANHVKRCSRRYVRYFSDDLTLQIKDPAFLLTHIASHYRQLSKIIAEFVDNSLDDAEKLAVEGEDGIFRYKRPVKIDIRLTPITETSFAKVEIVDNCFGMSSSDLSGLVNNIGKSRKRKDPTTNGYFGFGVNSFRACSASLFVRTKHESGAHYIEIDKEDTTIPAPSAFSPNSESPILSFEAGTHVTLLEVVRPFTSQMRNVEKIQKELSQHFFHHLANRENLTITITDIDLADKSTRITTLKAQQPPIKKDHWLHEEEIVLTNSEKIKIKVGVLPNDYYSYPDVAVVSRGREVQKLNELDSFKQYKILWKQKHANKDNLWDKPQIKGFIDVGNAVEQVISRNEFKETMKLEALYDSLLKFGANKKSLEKVNNIIGEANSSKMGQLSNFMAHIIDRRKPFVKARERMSGEEEVEPYGGRTMIDKAIEKEKKAAPPSSTPRTTLSLVEKQKREMQQSQNRGRELLRTYRGEFPIEFEHAGKNNLRARMEGTTTIINEDHVDAQTELYQGSPDLKINSRSFRYLARQVSNTFLIREISNVEKENIANYINEVQNLEVEIQRSFEKFSQPGMFDEDSAEEDTAHTAV